MKSIKGKFNSKLDTIRKKEKKNQLIFAFLKGKVSFYEL